MDAKKFTFVVTTVALMLGIMVVGTSPEYIVQHAGYTKPSLVTIVIISIFCGIPAGLIIERIWR